MDFPPGRTNDSNILIWLQVDPLWEKTCIEFIEVYPGWSPYNYVLNNPLRYFDPDGRYTAETMDGRPVPRDEDEITDNEGGGDEKKKEEQKTNIVAISFGAAGAFGGGLNIDFGLIINTENLDALGFFSWGLSPGIGLTAGFSGVLYPNSTLEVFKGDGTISFNNLSKIEIAASPISIIIPMTAPNDISYGPIGSWAWGWY